ncbi:MAG: ribose-phosphate pyrophosphokinae [Alphaproteobacteria bacterium]|nr:ribose-phosphate pyrophosphokinae [Alphaproteobacteria bacterium]
MNKEFAIFTGTANPALARLIASKLGGQVGACVVDRYPDSNVVVQLLETVRRKEVFLMQSTSPPVGDHLVELLAGSRLSPRWERALHRFCRTSATGERISGMAGGSRSWRGWWPILWKSSVLAI